MLVVNYKWESIETYVLAAWIWVRYWYWVQIWLWETVI